MNEVERVIVRRVAIKVEQRQGLRHFASIGQQALRENAVFAPAHSETATGGQTCL